MRERARFSPLERIQFSTSHFTTYARLIHYTSARNVDSIREFQRIRRRITDIRRLTRPLTFPSKVSNESFKQETVRSMEARRIVDTGRSSVFRNRSERVHCEILFPIIPLRSFFFSPQQQRHAPLSPILFLPAVVPSVFRPIFFLIVLFYYAPAVLADSFISRREGRLNRR